MKLCGWCIRGFHSVCADKDALVQQFRPGTIWCGCEVCHK